MRSSHAALNGQLSVHYQPKHDARTQAMTGAEALLRWNLSGVSAPVAPPAEFIPPAERNRQTHRRTWRLGGRRSLPPDHDGDALGMPPQRICRQPLATAVPATRSRAALCRRSCIAIRLPRIG
ncbi:EAL domain-containing protein [Cupriavidus basilensis]